MVTTATKLSTDATNTTAGTPAATTAGTTAKVITASTVATTNTNIGNHNEQYGFCQCRLCSLQVHQSHDGMMIRLQPCGCLFCKDCMIQSLATTIVKIVNGKQSAKVLDCFHCRQVVSSHNGERFQPLAAATTKKTPLLFDYTVNHQGDFSQILQMHNTPAVARQTPTRKRQRGTPRNKRNPPKKTVATVGASVNVLNPTADSATPITKRKRASLPTKHPPRTAAEGEGEASKNPTTPPPVREKISETTFEEIVKDLKAYKEKYGHCSFATAGRSSLSRRLRDIRMDKYELTMDQQKILEELEFNLGKWGHLTFEERVRALQAYKEENGNCDVPSRIGCSLASWVFAVRRGAVKVTLEQRQILNKMGFNWETKYTRNERLFNVQLEKLKRFKAKHGHCIVPYQWPEDPVFREWISTQRRLNHRGRIQPHRKKILDEMGFVWNLNTLDRKERLDTRNKIMGKNISRSSPRRKQQKQQEDEDDDEDGDDDISTKGEVNDADDGDVSMTGEVNDHKDEDELCNPSTYNPTTVHHPTARTNQLIFQPNIQMTMATSTHYQHPIRTEYTLPTSPNHYSLFYNL